MATVVKTYGYDRRSQVPGNGTPKACSSCRKWFAPLPRQRRCDGCQPRAVRAKQATVADDTKARVSQRILTGQRVVKKGFVSVYSEYLKLTFRCPVRDPRAARLETIVLAHEEAARQLWEAKRP